MGATMSNENPSSKESIPFTNWMAERQFLGRFYQSQGFLTNETISNDCGPTSLAMIVNLLTFQANLFFEPFDKTAILSAAGLHFWERLPAWLASVGGATTPWGMVSAFNRLAGKLHLNWHAERKSNARRAHVVENLISGKPVTALKVWKSGGAHWVNLLRFSVEKDKVYFLDPNPYLEYLSVEKRLQSQHWHDFEADWSRSTWWTHLFGIHCELIIYSKTT